MVQQQKQDCCQDTGQAGCLCVGLYGLGAGSPQQLLSMSMRVACRTTNQRSTHLPGGLLRGPGSTHAAGHNTGQATHSDVVTASKHADPTGPGRQTCARSSAGIQQQRVTAHLWAKDSSSPQVQVVLGRRAGRASLRGLCRVAGGGRGTTRSAQKAGFSACGRAHLGFDGSQIAQKTQLG